MAADEKLVGRYLEELYRWNKKVNLTSVARDKAQAVLIEPSLAMAEFFPPGNALEIFDIGSGGGLPAIPLAIRYLQHRFTLVESDRKKSIFLQHAASLLGLKNVRVLNERSEKISQDPAYAAIADVVTSRAVKREDVFSAAGGLLKPAGRVIIHHTPDAPEEFGGYRLFGKNPSADCFTRAPSI
ncbi:MAG: 16S rRNA (guanine(527)-N(7))-methyltransferase RsmG [Nitrospinae bacterium]|nr:16S rRNA (guanine(527)-N(7))-methyltransferase RsmG [Nitrospinota bacterium]